MTYPTTTATTTGTVTVTSEWTRARRRRGGWVWRWLDTAMHALHLRSRWVCDQWEHALGLSWQEIRRGR